MDAQTNLLSRIEATATQLQAIFREESRLELARGKALDSAAKIEGFEGYLQATNYIAEQVNLSVRVPDWCHAKASSNLIIGGLTESDTKNPFVQIEAAADTAGKPVSQPFGLFGFFEVDEGCPRLILSRSESDDPLLSIHGTPEGLLIQYMRNDNRMIPLQKADLDQSAPLIERNLENINPTWFVREKGEEE